MYEVKYFLHAEKWGVEKDGLLVRLFGSFEAAERYAQNKNEEG